MMLSIIDLASSRTRLARVLRLVGFERPFEAFAQAHLAAAAEAVADAPPQAVVPAFGQRSGRCYCHCRS